jgi:hypothetical protein
MDDMIAVLYQPAIVLTNLRYALRKIAAVALA